MPDSQFKKLAGSRGHYHRPSVPCRHQGGKVEANAISDQVAHLVVVRMCKAAKLDPAKYAVHSLRSGFVTQACVSGASCLSIMQQTQHKIVGHARPVPQAHNPVPGQHRYKAWAVRLFEKNRPASALLRKRTACLSITHKSLRIAASRP